MLRGKKTIALLLVLVLFVSLAACGQKPTSGEETSNNQEAKKLPVIALSNSYYGNIWRKQMVETFEAAAKEAKAKGLIADYIILNGDGTHQQQLTQMNDLILRKVDVIAINSASPTALNGVIKTAQEAGIKVLSFDSIATEPNHFKLSFDFVRYGEQVAEYAVERFNGKANVLVIRGVAGSAPDADMYQGMMNVLSKHPEMNIVGTVHGQATTAVTNQQVSAILPSLPQVDVVLCQGGGDSYGVVQAFEQANKQMPIITGDGSAEFIKWWYEQSKQDGYTTMSLCSTPGIGGAAFWVSLAIAEERNVPKEMMMPFARVDQDQLSDYKDMAPNTIVSPIFTQKWVDENIVR